MFHSFQRNKNLDLNVCIEGQVRAGVDSRDAWMRMLEEIQLVTHPVASSIVERYPTVSCLYDAYRQCSTHEQRELLLADIEVSCVEIMYDARAYLCANGMWVLFYCMTVIFVDSDGWTWSSLSYSWTSIVKEDTPDIYRR